MAKGKLTKLKSVLKKWNSFSHNKRSAVANDDSNNSSSSYNSPLAPELLHPIFVGNTRRRYLVSSDVVKHPLFRELVEKSEDQNMEETDKVYVACEVVLFEHLLWMIDNADPKPESFDELAEFYAC